MDESELEWYEEIVFGDEDPFGKYFIPDPIDQELVKNIYDEEGSVEGCYITNSAPFEW